MNMQSKYISIIIKAAEYVLLMGSWIDYDKS